jgi:hypothetical protein
VDTAESEASFASAAPAKPWPRRIGRALFLYVVVPYLAVVLIFAVIQRRLMYRPTSADDLRAEAVRLDPKLVRDVQIETPDGATLRGWLLTAVRPDSDERSPLVIYFPGNSLNRHERLTDLREVARSGFDVLIFDYRGYGDSTGSPSEGALTADAQRVWEFARDELQYTEDQIVIFGESLGGAVAILLWSSDVARHPQPAALILNSTFTSMSSVVAWQYPWFPFQYVLLDRWPSIERIGQVRSPVVVFHGDADEMAPVSQGKELAASAAEGQFVEIAGGGHNDIPIGRLRRELRRIRAVLDRDE